MAGLDHRNDDNRFGVYSSPRSISAPKEHPWQAGDVTVRVGIQPFPASGNLRLDFRFAKMRTTATSCRVLNPGIVSAKTKGHLQGVLLFWRKRGDSNPWAREDYTISNRARYDHFDTLPYYVFILKLCRDFYRQLFYFICFLFKCQLFFNRFIKLFKVFWFFAPLRQLLRFPCSAYYDINHLQNKLRYDIIRYGEIYGSYRI